MEHHSLTLDRTDLMAARIGATDAGRFTCREPRVPVEQLGRFGRAMVWMFGDETPNALANPRLEAVRRFFCATRSGHQPGAILMSELHKYGVMPSHLAALAELVA
jgi:hypothetical protein